VRVDGCNRSAAIGAVCGRVTWRFCGTPRLLQPQGSQELGFVETDNDLPINRCHRSRHISESAQFLKRIGISNDVAFPKLNSLCRKKLFRLIAEHSTGLGEYCDLLDHSFLTQAVA
jgi:hypothetical protein